MKLMLAYVFFSLTTFVAFSQGLPDKFAGCEIMVDNKWIAQESGTRSLNLDSVIFDQLVLSKIQYPRQALRMGTEGAIVCFININKSGAVKYSIENDLGSDTKIEVAKVLDILPTKWTPASINNLNVESRVKVLFKFHLDELSRFNNSETYYKAYFIMATGSGKWKTIDATNLQRKKRKK